MVIQGISLLLALVAIVCCIFNKRTGMCWCLAFLILWTFLYFFGGGTHTHTHTHTNTATKRCVWHHDKVVAAATNR